MALIRPFVRAVPIAKARDMILNRILLPLWFRPVRGFPSPTRLGSAYGGWWVILESIRPDSWIISAGVGDDASWDEAIHAHTSSNILLVDPTPIGRRTAEAIPGEWCRFIQAAVSGNSGELTLGPPADENHVSYSVMNRDHPEAITVDARTIPELIASVPGEVDLIKLDIEGSENGALQALEASPHRPGQILVELDDRRWNIVWATLSSLHRMGYAPIQREYWNLTLAHQVPTEIRS